MTTLSSNRLRFVEARAAHMPEVLCQAVEEGLTRAQKELPCRYFYDSAGSDLFEQICRLPEYYPTRTEQAILERHAPEMLEAAGREIALVEFGSGSSYKTRILMTAALDRQSALHYAPIDISTHFLRESAHALLEEYDRLSITAIAGEYRDGIRSLPAHEGPRLILFLGSNIGNFEEADAVSFLAAIRARMQPHDRILVGVDLVKDRAVLHAAYNDSQGITANFNKNLLLRINRELGGEFQLNAFTHDAPFVEKKSRIEMRLVSQKEQCVRIGALDKRFAFAQGEYINTENSHKYTLDGFTRLSSSAGLMVQERWLDSREWFAVLLLKPEAENASTDRQERERRAIMPAACTHQDQIADVEPSAEGCEDCLRDGGTWVHLRTCLMCGHVGCCDSSPNKHATKHFHATQHPIIKSFEPGEDWRWCYIDQVGF